MKLRVNALGFKLTASLLILSSVIFCSRCQAQYQTSNFEVFAPHPALARQVGDMAEKFRKELAELWLGQELPRWSQRCPITVEIRANAGGETSFAFSPGPDGRSQPFEWRMKIFGSPERILDSVLPHEVTHTIFATHYGRPLPRWADEGACTTVEHVDERKKNHQMLMEFLTTNRGIPFNHMFAMKQYPRDILPLYAQGYSLAKFLIQQRGHRHYVNFVGEGMQQEIPGREPATWNKVTRKYYGFEDLSDLQISWLRWVKKGCPDLRRTDVAVNAQPANLSANTYVSSQPVAKKTHEAAPVIPGTSAAVTPGAFANGESWYARQSRTGGNTTMQRPGQQPQQQSPTHYMPGSVRSAIEPRPMQHRGGDTLWR